LGQASSIMFYLLIVPVSSSQLVSLHFFLLYGRDPRLPTEAVLSPSKMRLQTDLHEYGIYIADKFYQAWSLARTNIRKA